MEIKLGWKSVKRLCGRAGWQRSSIMRLVALVGGWEEVIGLKGRTRAVMETLLFAVPVVPGPGGSYSNPLPPQTELCNPQGKAIAPN